MQPSGFAKPVLVGLLLALAIYAGGFALDQHLRTRRGPWEVTFTNEPTGAPAIIVNHRNLNVANLRIVFLGETVTNGHGLVVFDVPQRPVPFGRVKFEDLTYLPGTVTFDFFGHEIELLPRTLYINRKAHPWRSNEDITLSTTEKPATLSEPKGKAWKR
jgi:hypothetical protein